MELETILQTLTLEEKAALLQGWTTWTSREVKRLGIPSIFLSDGPHGLRKQEGAGDHLGLNASVPATCFPTAAATACSWDPAPLARSWAAPSARRPPPTACMWYWGRA